MRIIAQVVIEYMYKVLKNERDVSKFRKEFAAIRHGDYGDFIDLIGNEINFIVSYNGGVINTETAIRNDDSDFGRLIKSGESLKAFLRNCLEEFGEIEDSDIGDEIFEQLALFELSLRMHRNNNAPRVGRITLEKVIDELKEIKKLTDSECKSLHKGRRFLNSVKRPEKMETTWAIGITEFSDSFKVLQSKRLIII
jgi:hypothetical protein